jgi:phosphomannomutase/phosphoglucomutase
MHQSIFREYDIRGRVPLELVPDKMYDLGRALASFFTQKNPQIKTIALGMDGRVHSPQLKQQMQQALLDSGLDVVFIGLCPSPVLYFALHTQAYDAGVMITASHNPKEYNGVKLCVGKESIYGHDVQELYNLYAAGARMESAVPGTYREQEIIPAYIDWLAQNFEHLRNMPLSAVIDCGNGAGGAVIPELVRRMGWQHVHQLYTDIDGNYPHHEADPVKPENMRDVANVLASTDIELGIGLDGDADRMVPMTKEGILVSGDQLLGLFAQEIVKEYPGSAVVFDIKSSQVLIDHLRKLGMQPVISPSGHAIVKREMRRTDALLAGELSCHFFFHDRYFGFDDGIYAMMRVFELVLRTGKSLDQLLTCYPTMASSPEYRITCDEDKKQLIVQTVKDIFLQKDDVQVTTIDGVRVQFASGWGLLRASNTQPALSMRFEAAHEQELAAIKQEFKRALAPFFTAAFLEQQFSE